MRDTREVRSPATGEVIGSVPIANHEDCAAAVAKAKQAAPGWRALGFEGRRKALLEVMDLLVEEGSHYARLVSAEQGKPIAEAIALDVFPAVEHLRFCARNAERVLRPTRVGSSLIVASHKKATLTNEPFGVVVAITPWNYPVGIPLADMATALAAGNTVVLKPASATTLTGLAVGELFKKAGMPEGVVNVCAVPGSEAACLVGHEDVGKVMFTGGEVTAADVLEEAHSQLTPCVLELGGKDAAVVAADADLEYTARGLVWAALANCGQTCAAVERVYVERSAAGRLVELICDEVGKLKVGDPVDEGTDIGPMTLTSQRRIVDEHVCDAMDKGATLVCGGHNGAGNGTYYLPTVLTGCHHSMKVMTDETFGPVIPVMEVDSLDEAVRLANESRYGLTASAWTGSASAARKLAEALSAGTVTVNDHLFSFGEGTAPWGGLRGSGFGRTHAQEGLRELSQRKYVSMDAGTKAPAWWFPYDAAFARYVGEGLEAIYARRLGRKLAAMAGLVGNPRFMKTAHLGAILANTRKML
jgi:succinate-semialdehyde dehydrogenase/glutarate-semialdehyde dehydrogenase